MSFTECSQRSDSSRVLHEQNQMICPQNYKMHKILLHPFMNPSFQKRLCIDCRSDLSESELNLAVCMTGLTGKSALFFDVNDINIIFFLASDNRDSRIFRICDRGQDTNGECKKSNYKNCGIQVNNRAEDIVEFFNGLPNVPCEETETVTTETRYSFKKLLFLPRRYATLLMQF